MSKNETKMTAVSAHALENHVYAFTQPLSVLLQISLVRLVLLNRFRTISFLKKDEGSMQVVGMVWKKQKRHMSSKMQPLVIGCLLQATPFHLCQCEKERGGGRGEGSHFHLDHCLSLSVKGT